MSVTRVWNSMEESETELPPCRCLRISRPASWPIIDPVHPDDWMQGRPALHAIPHFLAFPVSWVMMYTTQVASVGKELGCRLNRSWHWVRKLLQSPGAPSYLSSGGRRSLWKPRMGTGGDDTDPRSGGAEDAAEEEEAHGAKTGSMARDRGGKVRHLMGHGLHALHHRQQLLLDSRTASCWPSFWWSWAGCAGSMMVRTYYYVWIRNQMQTRPINPGSKPKSELQINKQGLGRIGIKNKGCRIQSLYKLACT